MKELALKRKNEEVTMGSKNLSIHIPITYAIKRKINTYTQLALDLEESGSGRKNPIRYTYKFIFLYLTRQILFSGVC